MKRPAERGARVEEAREVGVGRRAEVLTVSAILGALALLEEEVPVLRLVVADVFVLALRKIRMVADAGAVGHPASAPRAPAASARAGSWR